MRKYSFLYVYSLMTYSSFRAAYFMTTQMTLTQMFHKIEGSSVREEQNIPCKEIVELKGQNVQKLKDLQNAEKFLTFLAHKCRNFSEYVVSKDSKLLLEQIWKNQALLDAVKRFPRFSHEELQRLVDRDLKYMGDEERKKELNNSDWLKIQTIKQETVQLERQFERK